MLFALWDKIIAKNKLKPHRRLFSGFTFTSFEDFNLVQEKEWDEAIKNTNLFLCYNYLKVTHQQQSVRFRFRYVIIYSNKQPIGVIYFQINDFSASLFGEVIEKQIDDANSKRASVFKKYIEYNQDETIMRLITCGNNFVSGEHGFYIDVNNKETTFKIVEKVIDCVSREEKLRGKISLLLVKDFYEEGFGNKDCWHCRRYVHFNVEPNMIVTLPSNLDSLENYIVLFSKKYRQRYRHIAQASSTLVKKRLTYEDAVKYNDTIYSLYLQVFENAKFKFEALQKDYFLQLLQQCSHLFYIDAWFYNNELVSFASGFKLDHEIEAHYIGFDYAKNKELELYQTILYSFVEEGILLSKKQVNLGRTASEIKSTVGAKAHDLICYLKPQNTFSKLLLKPFMRFLQPSDWLPRNPFKE